MANAHFFLFCVSEATLSLSLSLSLELFSDSELEETSAFSNTSGELERLLSLSEAVTSFDLGAIVSFAGCLNSMFVDAKDCGAKKKKKIRACDAERQALQTKVDFRKTTGNI